MSVRSKPKTSKRKAPHQSRSQQTLDAILSAAAALLEEVGFESLSTNAICKRAGLTPPALYRYFPNKYAVLKELGERLMQRQNALLLDQNWLSDDLEHARLQIRTLLVETLRVTRETQAGAWIMRSMHATPFLANVRLNSHRAVAKYLSDQVMQVWPTLDHSQAFARMRLGVEMGYVVIEMVFDEHDADEAAMIEMATDLLTYNLRDLITSSGLRMADNR